MKKLVLLEHISLDSLAASADRGLEWAHVDEEIFEDVLGITMNADTALYGRTTYGIMDAYWPTAGDKPGASKHDREHSKWFNSVQKYVISNTMKQGPDPKTAFIGGNVADRVREIKNGPGSDILMLGSPTAAHALMAQNLIDEYRLYVNQVILGEGIPLFGGITGRIKLRLRETWVFSSGVIGLNYERLP